MNKLIDVACPECGARRFDVWSQAVPVCCGAEMERCWAFVRAPGITPQGMQPERNTGPAPREAQVDVRAIAAETKAEIEQKWLRYADEAIAEQHVQRETDFKAGMCDEAGNLKPLPKPEPITFAKPPEAYAP